MEFIGGSKGLLGMHAPLLVQVPSFSYSFQQKSCQIIVFFFNLKGWCSRLGNPESTTGIGTERTLNHPGIKLRNQKQEEYVNKIRRDDKSFLVLMYFINVRFLP